MDSDAFRKFVRQHRIYPQIDLSGNLNEGAQLLIDQVAAVDPSVHFIPSTDRNVTREEFIYSFLGETLEHAIVKMESEYPVVFTLTDREDGGVDVSLEYYPRVLTFGEVVEYRRTHPEP